MTQLSLRTSWKTCGRHVQERQKTIARSLEGPAIVMVSCTEGTHLSGGKPTWPLRCTVTCLRSLSVRLRRYKHLFTGAHIGVARQDAAKFGKPQTEGRWLSTYRTTKKCYHGSSAFQSLPVPLQFLVQPRPPSAAFHPAAGDELGEASSPFTSGGCSHAGM